MYHFINLVRHQCLVIEENTFSQCVTTVISSMDTAPLSKLIFCQTDQCAVCVGGYEMSL